MSLQDRFRIDELTKNGSKSITRDTSGDIVVRKINKKEVPPVVLSDKPKPYGTEPIKSKKVSPTLKAELIDPPKEIKPEQQSFSGETSTHIERPFYNEEELQKAVDLKVDELIKEKKPKRGNFVRKEKYDAEVARVRSLNNQLQDLRQENSSLKGEIQTLQSEISSVLSQLESTQQELSIKDQTLQNLITKYEETVGDLQTAIIKGTKEAVERAALSAQVKGLQAQKETLSAQLKAQRGINESLKTQIEQQAIAFQGILNTQQAQTEALRSQTETLGAQVAQTQSDLAAAQAEASRAQAESASKGKKIICNELYRQGFLREELWDADERYGDMMFEKDPRLVIGYQMWARYVVKFMRENQQYSKFAYWVFKPWTEFMGHEMGIVKKQNWRGKFTNFVGKYVSYLVFDLNNGQRLLDLYNYKKFQESIG